MGKLAKKRVAILGGGVGGLSAAHELLERGFEVSVYELKTIPGGKARSIPVPGTGESGRKDLPGEHGFRFFPGFYKHLTDTMKRTPYKENERGVFDNLVAADRINIARVGKPEIVTPAKWPTDWSDLKTLLRFALDPNAEVPEDEMDYFTNRIHVLLTSCTERRYAEYESITWWNFIQAEGKSEAYQRLLAIGLCRCLVAMRPETGSARTVGYILIQLLLSLMGQGDEIDRVLNGPTSEVWLQPWLEHLLAAGLDYHPSAEVLSIACDDKKVTGAQILENGKKQAVVADYYIAAFPVEVIQRLVSKKMMALDPALKQLKALRTEWMTGIQFFLNKDIEISRGHTVYSDSPWAITSISQKQFWDKIDLTGYGDGTVKGILSVDVSDWNTPGILYGKPAKECTAEEIKNEVWAQLKAHLNDDDTPELEDDAVVDWFLDPDITFPSTGKSANSEPLLINTVDSWWDRPEATTKIPNFFLAADYVRTYSDLSCMEAANEAARRAVNGILKASGSNKPKCEIWPLKEPAIFAPDRGVDYGRFKLGLPNIYA